MNKNFIVVILGLALFFTSCAEKSETTTKTNEGAVSTMQQSTINTIIDDLVKKHGEAQRNRIERCVNQTAILWQETDGDKDAFHEFCMNNFVNRMLKI